MLKPYLAAVLILGSSSLAAAPDFVSSPSKAYDGFLAINPPRADVPVGALWIDGYGPTGEAAAADNIETVRSLNTLALDRNLQISLSASILNLLGVDPRFRDHYTARFSDLSIVRVKQVDRLSGPTGAPRIVEAIKAGSISVTTDGEAGLNARSSSWDVRKVEGNATSGRTRSSTIEGRDLFIAVRLGTLIEITSKAKTVDLAPQGSSFVGTLDGQTLIVHPSPCVESIKDACPPGAASFGRAGSSEPESLQKIGTDQAIELMLPIPRSDGEGGLFDRVRIQGNQRCLERQRGCGESVVVRYAGWRMVLLEKVNARDW